MSVARWLTDSERLEPMAELKRYAIIVQHEVIVYGYSPETTKAVVTHAYGEKAKFISIKELPPIEIEAEGCTIIDRRNAPWA